MKNKNVMYYLRLKAFVFGEYYASTILSFLLPVSTLFFSVFSLILADFVTGYIAAKMRGEKIESRKMWRSAYKCIAFLIILIGCHSIDTNILSSMPDVPFLNVSTAAMMSLLIVITELKSIDENIFSAFGWSYWGLIEEKISVLKFLKFKKNSEL